MITIYIYKGIILQLLLTIVDISFFFLNWAIILCSSIVDSQATQAAYLVSSFSGIYDTLMGEGRRYFLRKTSKPPKLIPLISQPRSESPQSLNPSSAIAGQLLIPSSDAHTGLLDPFRTSTDNTKLEVIESVQQIEYDTSSHSSTGVSIGLFSIFWICFFATNYVSSLVNIGLGKISNPIPNFIPKNLSLAGDNYPQWYFNLTLNGTTSQNEVFYELAVDYYNADRYDWIHKNDYFDDDLIAQSRGLLGTGVYELDSFSCFLYDESTWYIRQSGPLGIPVLKARTFLPNILCTNVTNTYYAYSLYPSLTNDTSKNFGYGDGYENSIFIGDNTTLLALDRENKTVTATTLTVLDYQLKSLDIDTADVNTAPVQYTDWFNGLWGNSGFSLPDLNDTFYSQFVDQRFEHQYTPLKTLYSLFQYMEANVKDSRSFVCIFTLQKKSKNERNQFLRFIINYDTSLYNYEHQAVASLLTYSTQTNRYNITLSNPTSLDSNSTFHDSYPKTIFYNSSDMFHFPVLFSQPLKNVKQLPVVASGFAKFANYTMVDSEIINMTYGIPDGFKYDVTVTIIVIVFIYALALLMFVCAGLVKGGHFVRIPQYYDLLHEHYQNGKNCAEDIQSISKPLYTGHAFVENEDKNYLGIMDLEHLKKPPNKKYPYM